MAQCLLISSVLYSTQLFDLALFKTPIFVSHIFVLQYLLSVAFSSEIVNVFSSFVNDQFLFSGNEERHQVWPESAIAIPHDPFLFCLIDKVFLCIMFYACIFYCFTTMHINIVKYVGLVLCQ